ncbi:MAG: serine hydrolase domain-containing protein [Thermomicrobiales bacterium]
MTGANEGAMQNDFASDYPPNPALQDQLREIVRDALHAGDAPGATIALMTDGSLVWNAGVGHRDMSRLEPLAVDAGFYLYSITKIFLAIAILRLTEEGRLALDDPIQNVLPEAPFAELVTLRQLLNHTSGLPDYGALPEYERDVRERPGQPWSADAFLAHSLRRGFRFPPGEGWAYSNIGMMLVRQAIERTVRGSLREALDDLVFRPVGLRQTVVAESLHDSDRLTAGYTTQLDADGALRDMAARYHPGWVAHGVAISTAADLARALDALFAGRLLTAESLRTMMEAVPVPAAHPQFVRPGYGLGLMIDLGSRYGLVAGHGGGGPGYSTAAFHFSDVRGHRVTSVALVNRDQPELATPIAFALVTAYADHLG